MTCEQFEARLTAFSLGELESHEAVSAREHVARCSHCASRALVDRQLTALVRSTAEPMPEAARRQVLAALRAEARAPGHGRRKHWLSLGAATGLAAALVAAAMLLVPAPARSSPLAAAWGAYRTQPLMLEWNGSTQNRLTAVLGAAAITPDLTSFGFHVQGAGGRMLAGHLAAVTEFRDDAGHRVTYIRWKGDLPEMPNAQGPMKEDPSVQAARWGTTGSIWWSSHGIVYCLIGGIDQRTLYQVTEHLQSAENR